MVSVPWEAYYCPPEPHSLCPLGASSSDSREKSRMRPTRGRGRDRAPGPRPEFQMHVLQVAIQDSKVLALPREGLAGSSML